MNEPATTDKRAPRDRIVWIVAWVALIGVATVLRGVELDRESYWLDELATLDVITERWSRFVGVLAAFDNHPPLYFVLAKAWSSIFGVGEVPLRALSASLGVASVLMAAGLAASCVRVGGREHDADTEGRARWAAWFAGAVIAVAPLAVRHAREARMYALLECTSLATVWLLVRLWGVQRSRARVAVAYGVAATAMLYTHVYGMLLLGGQIVVMAAAVAFDRRARRGATMALVAAIAACVAFAPWIPVVRARTSVVSRGFWLVQPTWTWPLEWGGGRGVLGAMFVVAIVVAAASGLVRFARPAPRAVIVLVASFVSVTLAPIAAGAVYRPIFTPKYAIVAAALVTTIAALAVASVRRQTTRMLAMAAVVLAGLFASVRNVVASRLNEDWRSVAAWAARACDRPGVRVAAGRYAPMYRHYLPPTCVVLDLEPLAAAAARGDDAARWEPLLAGSHELYVLEVHPPRTDAHLERWLSRRFVRAEQRDWLHARAVRWTARATAP